MEYMYSGDLKLDDTNDITVANGDLVMVSSSDNIRQLIEIAIKTKLGEVLFDENFGNPAIGMRTKNTITGANVIRNGCIEAMRSIVYIRNISRFNVSKIDMTECTIDYIVTTIYDTVVTGSTTLQVV